MSVFSPPFKPLCKKRGVASVFKARAHSTLLLLSPLSLLCTLKAQVEAGVSQLKYIHFPGFLPHTYLTSMNGALLTPFILRSKQVLLAQLMCNNLLCNGSPPHCISSIKGTLLTRPNCSDRVRVTLPVKTNTA